MDVVQRMGFCGVVLNHLVGYPSFRCLILSVVMEDTAKSDKNTN